MCTIFCKLRCLMSIIMIVAGMTMIVDHAHADEAAAAEQATAPASVTTPVIEKHAAQGGDYLLQLLSGMAIVIASIVLLAWFARKMNRFSTSSDGSLQILGGLSMGSRERIVLIEVAGEQLLLGVSPGRINTLHVLENGIDRSKTAPAKGAGLFSNHLADRLQQAAASVKNTGRTEA